MDTDYKKLNERTPRTPKREQMTRTVLWGARRHDIQAGSRQDQYRQRLLNGEIPTDITIKIHVEGIKKFMAACMSAQEAMTSLRKAANTGINTKEMAQQARNQRLQ